MAGHGFTKVYNLSGGISAWEGETAQGPLGLHLDLVRGDEPPGEIIKLAYAMEQGLGGFYTKIKGIVQDPELSNLLGTLISAEEKHKQYLLTTFHQIEAGEIDREAFEAGLSQKIMEGGFEGEELFEKNRQFLETISGLLDLAMMLETQALDLYLRFVGKIESSEAKDVLYRIADEEKAHLQSLGKLRDRHA